MEDNHFMWLSREFNLGYFMIADGHGGEAVSEFLSKTLHWNIHHYLKQVDMNWLDAKQVEKMFEDVFSITDKQILRQKMFQSGATAVVCIVRYDPVRKCRQICVANVGDARAVLCRANKAVRLSEDHKPSDSKEAMLIKKRHGFVNRQQRVNGLLAVTRAFGDHLLKPPVSILPYVTCTDIGVDGRDDFLLLACDGLFDVMTDTEVVEYITDNMCQKLGVQTWPQIYAHDNYKRAAAETMEQLVRFAIDKRRTLDNVSVMLVCL
ncbi:protein phosphatase 2C-related protein [Reticulomyxa filosa]|uniref:Protein phosphatase 2C-related protein n=1 Tax=Reticulomyxa filosa TaxID=46433 RepID=X6P230_RETFI|nr:protein phosphatase 2C-related protein [Reticulomyxa filosa]|eukprot:ETO32124.1 protein phosphatase 2C-related protein [Reticulomyxa filosa]